MVLSTHAALGAAIAAATTADPISAFAIGFASHFVFDMIPHWHYPLLALQRSPKATRLIERYYFIYDQRFARDVLHTGIDFAIGLAATLIGVQYFAPQTLSVALAGAAGGAAPDLLQLAYYLWKRSPLQYLQHFHHAIHAKGRLDDQPLIGIGSQVVLILLATASFAVFSGR